ncbi:MAG: MFS transporter [Bacillota bacterium]
MNDATTVDDATAVGAPAKGAPARYGLPLFCIVTMLFWFSLYTYVSFFANHVESKGASHAWAGVIIAAYGFTQTVLRIPLGIFSDRLGTRKPFIVAGLLAATVSAFLLIFAESPVALMLLRGLAGVAAASWVAFTVLFSSYFPPARSAQAIGTITVYLNAGNTLGLLLGGRIAHFLGANAAFALATGAGLLGLILSRWVVDNFDGSASALTAASVLRVVGQPTLIASSCLALVLQAVAFATIYGFTPVYAEGIGATKESLANLAFISSVPAILGNYLAGKYFVPRMGEVATATFSFLLLAVFTAVIPFTGTMAGLYATQAVAGFARGVVLPVLMSLSIKNEPDETRATAMGVFQAVYGVGMVLGPIIAGIVGDLASLSFSFVLMGLVALVAALASALVLGRVQRRGSQLSA